MNIPWTLILPVLLCLSCEAVESPPPRGQAPGSMAAVMRPAPREPARRRPARPTAGCQDLCARHATCIQRFRTLRAAPLFGPTTAEDGAGCATRCAAAAADGVLGATITAVIRTCGPHRACDAFYGCALRQRLLDLQAHPWKRTVIRVRQELVAASVTARALLERCARLTPLRKRLAALSQPAARDALRELDARCRAALGTWLGDLDKALDRAEQSLKLAPSAAVCGQLERWARLRSAKSRALVARIRGFRTRCQGLAELRAVAVTVRDAEGDAADVDRQLTAGRLEDSAYHKCVHKAATLAALRRSTHPRARKAAATLQRVCFEQFPITWLRRAQRRSPATGAPTGGCYRITQVIGLLTQHGKTASQGRHQGLVQWAKARCPR